MAEPIVSVVIPAHGAARTIEATLDSLAAQTLTDFEILVVDDASTDGTPEVVEAWARRRRDPRPRVLRQTENRGPGAARNRALAEVRAPFIAFLDADDRATPDRLALQVAALEDRPDDILIGGWFDIVDDDGQVLAQRRPTLSPTLLCWTATLHGPILLSTLTLRRAALPANGALFSESWQGEGDVALRHLLLETGPGSILPRVVCLYRKGPVSAAARLFAERGGEGDDSLAAAHLSRLLGVPVTARHARRVIDRLWDMPDDRTPENREAVSLFLMTFLAFKRAAPPWCDPAELTALEEHYRALCAPILGP
jgi:glycosyltransferase involved in cell wall biosynthesis